MTVTALLLVLVGSALHAIWNIVAKQSAGGPAFVMLFGWVSVVAVTPLAIREWLALPQTPSAMILLAALCSAAIHVIYSLVLQKGYRVSDFAVVYPVARGVGPMLSVAGSVVLLGESPSSLGWAGIGAIVAGVLATAGAFEVLLAGNKNRQSGVLWGTLTGVCIASYTVVDGWAVKSLGAAPVLFFAVVLWLRALLLMPLAFRPENGLRDCWKNNRAAVVMVGVLSPTAYLMVLFALQLAPVTYVATTREVSMLMAAFLGAKFLREPIRGTQVAGAILLLVGVVTLALA